MHLSDLFFVHQILFSLNITNDTISVVFTKKKNELGLTWDFDQITWVTCLFVIFMLEMCGCSQQTQVFVFCETVLTLASSYQIFLETTASCGLPEWSLLWKTWMKAWWPKSKILTQGLNMFTKFKKAFTLHLKLSEFTDRSVTWFLSCLKYIHMEHQKPAYWN